MFLGRPQSAPKDLALLLLSKEIKGDDDDDVVDV